MTKITKNQLVFYIISNLKKEKRFNYLEIQRKNEAKINENFSDELLKIIINFLNSKTKNNTSEYSRAPRQGAIELIKKNEDIINIVTNEV